MDGSHKKGQQCIEMYMNKVRTVDVNSIVFFLLRQLQKNALKFPLSYSLGFSRRKQTGYSPSPVEFDILDEQVFFCSSVDRA